MEARSLAVISIAAVVLVSGCGSNTGRGTSTEVFRAPSTSATTEFVPKQPTTVATVATVSNTQVYTQDMYSNFFITVSYETTRNEDMDLFKRLDASGAAIGYQYGRDVCNALVAGQTDLRAIADRLNVNTGLTVGGAQAIIAGAVR
jgi:hypothetical protein